MSKSDYINYQSVAGAPGAEGHFERAARERYWRSLRKQIVAGARIRP